MYFNKEKTTTYTKNYEFSIFPCKILLFWFEINIFIFKS